MPLAPGDKLGSYDIVAPIGAGGMGDVYRARDPRLNRDVAIKISQERFSDRFEREARAVAALNHPNICTLYDIGPNYLVMELIEGESPKGPLPLDEVLRIARQIAAALDAAHEKGIVHRDLKPANIKIKPDGTVKVLDFGLAKTPEPAAGDPESSPTMTISPTRAGMILGTAAYMSPEQARGKAVDKRADIWAFGVVLYELLTGHRPFQGEDLTETLASVMKDAPDLTEVPAEIRPLLERCLEKDLKKRLRDIGDMQMLLSGHPAVAPAKSSLSLPLILAFACLAILALTISIIHFRETPTELPPLRASILPPDNATLDFTNGLGLPAISPDGRRIVFGARTADGKEPLWVRSINAETAQPLAGTDGATFPFWSPDSKHIAFFADDKLKKIDASGGPAITLADAPSARGGSWSPEGVILFAPDNGGGVRPLQRISSSGGTATPLAFALGRLPWFLPDGHHFLYQDQSARQGGGGITIRVASLDGGEPKELFKAESNAVYAQGYVLFLRGSALMAQPFDPKRLEISGEAVPRAEGAQSVLNTRTAGVFSVSENGLLALRTSAEATVLTWFGRDGKRGATVGDPAFLGSAMHLSPDQKSLLTEVQDHGRHVWIYDLARGVRTRLTQEDGTVNGAVWSPDGQSVAYSSFRGEHYDLYRRSANGAGAEELLGTNIISPESWSPDGKVLLCHDAGNRVLELWAMPLNPDQPGGTRKPFPVVQSSATVAHGAFSPDGHWIAYTSRESGRNEIYATPFPPGAGGKLRISSAGGVLPKWRQDGKEMFFSAPDGHLMAAEIRWKGDAFEVGQLHTLFLNPSSVQTSFMAGRIYEVTADGQRFLIPVPAAEKAPEPITIIQNWTAALRNRW